MLKDAKVFGTPMRTAKRTRSPAGWRSSSWTPLRHPFVWAAFFTNEHQIGVPGRRTPRLVAPWRCAGFTLIGPEPADLAVRAGTPRF